MAITLKDIVAQMQTGEVFSCTVISYDKKRKTGGRVLEYAQLRLVGFDRKEKKSRPETRLETLQRKTKAPRHYKHFTRNAQILVNGHPTSQVVKIHPPLVTKFNQQIVLG